MGLGLWAFGILGLFNRLEFFSTAGRPVLGLSSNGLLSTISLVVGAVLITAGVRGGRSASTVTAVVGVAFILSGFVNGVLMALSVNVLAFRIPNIIFSEVAGGMLLILGAVGRFITRLPESNPYQQQRHPDAGVSEALPTVYRNPEAGRAAAELAEAERAVAQGGGTPAEAAGVRVAGRHRRAEDRVESWRSAAPLEPDPQAPGPQQRTENG